ncbi:SDR family NAD(P)-dependent oxidoreductase [Phycisphaerales bacterium AB-hyl4]|uniref:SDR family NAD(P)-dependent oxidoreductase n=1 Tax=Natronomicrosphaera hydrolytica TaxID=3242702 RepID=A0ABV4UAY0_9BACT
MARELAGKVIFITGASSGIGAATARLCIAAGMNVALFARREAKLRELAGELDATGERVLVVAGSVERDEDIAEALEQTVQRFGRLDAVFANAGYGLCMSVMGMTDEQHHGIFETNYFGTVRTLRAAVPLLRQTADGLKHVLVCSSAASEISLPLYGAYAATKAAQDSIAGALRAELSGEGFSVTTVHPVGTKTEFFSTAGRLSNRKIEDDTPNTPAMFAQTAEQVARPIVRALRRPRPEVWPMMPVRFGLAMATAFPRLAAWAMRRQYRENVDG